MPDVKHFDPDAVLDVVVRLFWRQGEASTGIQEIVAATGINRSSLYATFGGKRELYLAALRRYVEQQSQPVFERLSADDRGLASVREFFGGLINARCSGPYARWGCMVSNAHAAAGSDAGDIRQILDDHHERLRTALRSALADLPNADAAADVLALLAYAVNLRSRAGAAPEALTATVDAALAAITTRETS